MTTRWREATRIARAHGSYRATRIRAWLRARPQFVTGAILGLTGFAFLFAGLLLGTWNAVCRDCPSIAQIYVWEPASATKILDRDRKLIAELFIEQNRTPIPLSTLPEHVPQAFIAVEDKRFYRHHGFDYRRLITANLRNLVSGRVTGGGSTITQQLARWMFPEEIGFEQVLTRKLKEARIARELEDVYSKDEILEAYINQVNYGHGWHGIETAAQHYFGKPAVELDPAEAALLAAVVNRPGSYSPFRNPERALERRNLVLRLMERQGYLSEDERTRWQQAPLPATAYRSDESKTAPYFVEMVREILDDRHGSDLYSKGFQVVTSLDLEMQMAAQVAMDSGWARIERTPGFPGPRYVEVMANEKRAVANETPYLQGMFVALDPHNGEIRALIGGRDFKDSKFNRATQALRQPGSTFKPFVYAAAIHSGIPASHVIFDSPVMLEQPDGSTYAPQNYDPEFRGPLTLRDALRHSVNTVAVKLGVEVGLETVAQTAKQLGLRTAVPPYPSTPIGAAEVIPLQLAEAFSVFANTGTLLRARPILRVEDKDGRLLWETRPEREAVLDPMAAAITRDLLRTALDYGTGANVRSRGNLPYEVPAAGKTGTTNDATNVWFAGFTPDLLAVVWFGFDRPRKIMENATGGGLAAPVWGEFMRAMYYGPAAEFKVPMPWPWPDAIITRRIDRESGKLAAQWCSEQNAYTEFFIPGTEPTESCSPSGGIFGAPLRPMSGDTVDTLRTSDTTRMTPVRRDTLRR